MCRTAANARASCGSAWEILKCNDISHSYSAGAVSIAISLKSCYDCFNEFRKGIGIVRKIASHAPHNSCKLDTLELVFVVLSSSTPRAPFLQLSASARQCLRGSLRVTSVRAKHDVERICTAHTRWLVSRDSLALGVTSSGSGLIGEEEIRRG